MYKNGNSSKENRDDDRDDWRNNPPKYNMNEIFKKCTNYKPKKTIIEKVKDVVKDPFKKKE